jgi:hypothetical protein
VGARLDALHTAQPTPGLLQKPDLSVRCATVSHPKPPPIAVVDPSRLLLRLRLDDCSCPLSDLRADRSERLSRVEIRHSFRRPEAAIRATAGEPSGYGPFPTHGQA